MSAIAFCRAFLKYISVEENRNKRKDDVEWNNLIDLFWSTPEPLSLALAGGRGHHGRGRPDESYEWIPYTPTISGTRSTLTSSWRTVISTATQTETSELNSTSTNTDNPEGIDDSRYWDSDDSSEENSLSIESRSVPVVLPCTSHSHLMPPPPGITGRRGRRIHFGRSLALMRRPQPVVLPPPRAFADQTRCRHHGQLSDILNQVTAMEEKVAEFEAYFLC